VLGLGWDQTKFSDTHGAFPTAVRPAALLPCTVILADYCYPPQDDLERDPRLQGRPIYLKRSSSSLPIHPFSPPLTPSSSVDVHALWVSPAVLALLPFDLPSEVPGGEIVRLPSGQPSGVFLDNAMQYISRHRPSSSPCYLRLTQHHFVVDVVPPWTDLARLSFLRRTTTDMLAHGLTGVHDAALSPADIAFFRTLDEGKPLVGEIGRKRTARGESRLPVRIHGMVGCVPTNAWCGDEVERYEGERFALRFVFFSSRCSLSQD
jgi:hypothetical protein